MCGIAGFCNYRENYLLKEELWKETLVKMRMTVNHRGGDQDGEYLNENVGFAHSRLSIRDVQGARQPMCRRIADNDYVIIYNGEIYNADELAAPLKEKGYIFETSGDTEVILYCYIEYGLEFVSMLNGIYAFAIWDGKEKRLVLYRDRVGVKPLFYSMKNNSLVFGSEIKALFAHPEIIPEADDNTFREIFGLGPARTAGCGVFKGVNEILPGSYAVFSKDCFYEHTYWKLEAKEHTDNYEQTVEMVSFLVKDAITRQMVSDIPICTFLSGGLDSSIVTAIASNFMSKHNQTLNTFSFDFSGNNLYFKANDYQTSADRPFVEKMLEAYNLNHTYLECNENILADLLTAAMQSKDLPGMADIDVSLMYFCSIVKKFNKVVLTGECADEVFCGYPWFYREDLFHAQGFPWSKDFAARTIMLKDELISSLDLNSYIQSSYEQSIRSTPLLYGENEEEKRHRQICFLNINWFMATLLDRMDRMSMASGLEARVPFADHRIIEYLYNVPWSMKYRNGVEKSLLRDACKDLIPSEILFRKKSPYPKIYNPQYESILAKRFQLLINDVNAPINRFISKEKAKSFLSSQKDYGKPWFGQLMAGPQMIAYLLQVNSWLEKYQIS